MAAGYTIVAQRQTTDLTPDGRFVDVMEITFQTTQGVTGSVQVPLSDYNVENVGPLIAARVAQINAIHNL